MRRIQKYRVNYLGYDINKLKLLGQGYEGKVYLLPEDKVLKVFYNTDSCKRQIEILLKTQDSRFFPSVFNFDDQSIVMSFIYGSSLSHYLTYNDINKKLSIELVKLIDEFKKLHFTRLDMRLGHIFIQPDETVKVIDPRGSYEKKQPYPKSMLNGLKKRDNLKAFLNYIKYESPDYYKYWRKMMCI
ncbi:MAG: serine/threonine protein kinase [Clostridiaceae bacterium]